MPELAIENCFTSRDALRFEQEIIKAALRLHKLRPIFTGSEEHIGAYVELDLWAGNLVALHEQVAEEKELLRN